jgi:endonuclease III-like uncharacterized protein
MNMSNRFSATSEKSAAKQVNELKSIHASEQQITAEAEGIYDMIATAAYYRAKRHGFEGVDEVENWLEAEKEIKAELFH